MSEQDIIKRTIKFALTRKSNDNPSSDMTLTKEVYQTADKVVHRTIKLHKDVMRPFYVTKGEARTHKQKKENELIGNVNTFQCTQAELPFAVKRALKSDSYGFPRIGQLCRSPYIYGTDISSATILKREEKLRYAQEFGEYYTDTTMATLDFETSMDPQYTIETSPIIMGSVTHKDQWYLAVAESFLEGIVDPIKKIHAMAEVELGKYMRERNVTLRVVIVKDDLMVVKKLMSVVHRIKPDVLAIWNMAFDIGKIVLTCTNHNVDPASIMCDPSIPAEYRNFEFKEQPRSRIKANGKKENRDTQDLWHKVNCLASYYVIDAMCLFSMIRAMEQKRNSYSLDAILDEILNLSKLKFKEADHIRSGTPDWHTFMQKHYKIEYCVYCIFDCVAMELLDEKTGDISMALDVYAGVTELGNIKSNPRRLTDEYHFFLQARGKVLCGTSDNMTEEFDKLVLGKVGWIITLDNTLTVANYVGINPFDKEYGVVTRISKYAFDIDVKGSYPSNQIAMNMSKGATLVEVCAMEGVSAATLRHIAVNLTNAPVNAVQLCRQALNMPSLTDLERRFAAQNDANYAKETQAA